MNNDEQVIAPSFVTDAQRVTNENKIGMDKYCFMTRFVKHVCIRLNHMAHNPKNIKVCVNIARHEFKYRCIRRVDLSNEIVTDLESFRVGVADNFSTETMNCEDIYKHSKSDQASK